MDEKTLLEQAVAAARAGNTADAQRMLAAVLKANPQNELAWMWLVRTLPNDQQRMAALEQCLKANPSSDGARRALAQLRASVAGGRVAGIPTPAGAAPPTGETLQPGAAPPDDVNAPTGLLPVQRKTQAQIPAPQLAPRPTPLSDSLSEVERPVSTQARPAARRVRRSAAPGRKSGVLYSIGAFLSVLLLVLATTLGWIGFTILRSPPLSQAKLAATHLVETENASQRLEEAVRLTQTASQPTVTPTPRPTRTSTPTPTATLLPSPTPTSVGLPPSLIDRQNAAALVVAKELKEASFTDFDFSSDGSLVAFAAPQGVLIWDSFTLKQTRQIYLENRAQTVAFHPSSSGLIFTQAGSGDESYLYSSSETQTSQLLGIGFTFTPRFLLFTSDAAGLVLVSTASTGNINVVSAQDGSLLAVFDHPGGVLAADLDPLSGRMATGGYDDLIRVWDLVGGHVETVLSAHAADITTLAFAPDGRFLVSASQDGAVLLWDTASWRRSAVLSSQGEPAVRAAFSPDGALLVTGSAAGQVIFWDAASGEALASLSGPDGLLELAFSSDGRLLVAAGENALLVWTPAQP